MSSHSCYNLFPNKLEYFPSINLPVNFGSYQWTERNCCFYIVVSAIWPWSINLLGWINAVCSGRGHSDILMCVCFVCVCVCDVSSYSKQQTAGAAGCIFPHTVPKGPLLCEAPVACIHLYNCPVAPHTESIRESSYEAEPCCWQVVSASQDTHLSPAIIDRQPFSMAVKLKWPLALWIASINSRSNIL